ncbi:hypothetical protein [Bradyrhizobium genomosp. III]|uniref:hypothetical protein n=1 Tax=Bradyrhizobium genomosp. III TaxID=2683271 RepID=UPI0012F4870F|nr:hypothetical protein [Bradyrhizobium sp. CCBAU 15635]
MSNDPDEMPDLSDIDQAMLSAISRRQREDIPLSLEQERLLDAWIAGALPSNEARQAAELTKLNKFAAEHILERRLIAAANEGPDVPSALSARILRGASARRPSRHGQFQLRWPRLNVLQWLGAGSALTAATVLVALGLQALWPELQPKQRYQIAMVAYDDRSVLFQEPQYRTRGKREQPTSPGTSSTARPTAGIFRDVEVPTNLLRRAIQAATGEKSEVALSELMSHLRLPTGLSGKSIRIVIDTALSSEIVPMDSAEITPVRVYDLDDPQNASLRSKTKPLSPDTPAILLTRSP